MTTHERTYVRPVDLIADALRGTDDIVAVTGATGWLGAVALDLLYEALGDQAATRVVGYASSEREVAVSDGRTVTVRPLLELVSQDLAPTTLPHFALFLTRDTVAALGVDESQSPVCSGQQCCDQAKVPLAGVGSSTRSLRTLSGETPYGPFESVCDCRDGLPAQFLQARRVRRVSGNRAIHVATSFGSRLPNHT